MSRSTDQIIGINLTIKSRKMGCANGEDRISNLPIHVISDILSLMSTKDAVRTSVLSKDWKYNWTFIYNIDIKSLKIREKPSFLNFMGRILLHTHHNIQSFSLTCFEDLGISQMTEWISVVLRRNVESLKVIYLHKGIVLPQSLLSCTSLRILKLEWPCTLKCSDTDPLIFSFPLLETFELRGCNWLNVKCVEIYAPALTILHSMSSFEVGFNDYIVKIYGDRIVEFTSWGGLPRLFVLPGSQVVYAELGYYSTSTYPLYQTGLQVRMLLQGFSSLMHLKIWGDLAKAIAFLGNNSPLPRFDMLERLDTYDKLNVSALFELLHAAPSLKSLNVCLRDLDDHDYDGVKPVPSCLVSRLEEITFMYSSERTPQLHLAKFLLKNATKLKIVHLCGSRPRDHSLLTSDKTVKQLILRLPRGSTCSTIVEDW
ncbi:hypothetical protein ACJIZ3_011593 [Penstemon smallii]|uniref:F-box domain-containing protein n=1 Tax=Penstemon smallii TaxID=265156 RepID=A0ABD3UJI1_9LAMI